MTDHSSSTNPAGRRLTELLEAHQVFVQNLYGLLRLIEEQLTARGWSLIRPNGYVVARNGWGSSLGRFSTADWILTQLGLAFAKPERAILDATSGSTVTEIGQELTLVACQSRWLDKAHDEPVMWAMMLVAKPDEGGETTKRWELYHAGAFNRLHAADLIEGEWSRLAEIRVVPSGGGSPIRLSGQYLQVPLSRICSASDAISLIVEAIDSEWTCLRTDAP
jgi:hypothetical protein